ncbi:AraC family transcriptional regulator [Nonomuraea solani]|uniref:AraC family transcriptional regulator n=1 Tax=Nonomuraea solani TaxID=1144553 RepID=UPI001F319A84|nr:AraC family transcriptional regulator [Nonomuraea solani]
MDVFARLMDGVKARGALFGQAVLEPPWSLEFATNAPLTLIAMLRDQAWLTPGEARPTPGHAPRTRAMPTGGSARTPRATEARAGDMDAGAVGGGEPLWLNAGDVAIVRGSVPFTVAGSPDTPPGHVVTADDYCAPEARPLAARTCGERPDGPALLLGGAYAGGVSERLLRALPRVLVVADGQRALLDLVAGEVAKEVPGQQVVLDRLLDLLLVSTLRSWFDRPGARAPGWYRATGDPAVDQALRLLHDDPAHPWTVASLAAKTATSRAAFARRFAEHVGEPPMRYLAGWRIALAADLLRDTDATVAAIARQVGYANAFALSVAFKRIYGMTPTERRQPGVPDRR